MQPLMSAHFEARTPSAIRTAQIRFMERTDGVEAINTAIGNVSLPAHPAMQKRMFALGAPGSPFEHGVVKYTATVGEQEANAAVLNVIASSGFETKGLHSQITNGGSQAMELLILGVCGPAGSPERPLMLIDAAYTNYGAFAKRLGRRTVSVSRTLDDQGRFSLPALGEIEGLIERERPGALVVIPYDNPTGHFYDLDTMRALAALCVKHGMWLISDEAYRELLYVDGAPASSIWALREADVPGITGRRIGIETASKVWNACGLRIGALVTDNPDFHRKCVAENTADLCPSAIGQYVFGALAHESHEDLRAWYRRQREYYRGMLAPVTEGFRRLLPGVIISNPDASIYSVVDVRGIARPGFDAMEFVLFCAGEGKVAVDGRELTLLVSPMGGFYSVAPGRPNPGTTQMRIAYVETPERMRLVPALFAELFRQYESRR
jgi:aspartate aminotransferase